MALHDKEHNDLIETFERSYPYRNDFTKEDKAQWPHGYIYRNGEINKTFILFRIGYSWGKVVGAGKVDGYYNDICKCKSDKKMELQLVCEQCGNRKSI